MKKFMLIDDLPAEYFPLESGLYEVIPGLKKLGTDFGNGQKDQKVFQLDCDYEFYHINKKTCRSEDIKKYYHQFEFSREISQIICEFIANQLVIEYPNCFQLKPDKNEGFIFESSLFSEALHFSKNYELSPKSSYLDAFDALACQVQEDLAVWRRVDPNKGPFGQKGANDYLCAVHLCAPNYWDPREKIGQNFQGVHAPVADNDKIIRPAKSLVEGMIEKGPFVRFAWGVTTDQRLNHHPLAPKGKNKLKWQGRAFNSKKPELYLRIERQTITSFPKVSAALFTIRTYFKDCHKIRKDPELCDLLVSALKSMSEDAQKYKGLHGSMDEILNWLTS